MLKTIFILIGIGLLGYLLFIMPIQIKFKFVRKNEDDMILVRYKSFYGLLNLKFELPMFDIVWVNGKPALKYKAEVETNKTNKLFKRISKIFTADDFQNIKKYFHRDPVLLRRMKEYWLKRMKIRDLSIILKFGLVDAAVTAMLCGSAWIIIGTAIAIMKSNLDLTTKNIKISPIFDKEGFETEFSCIINFRLGDIINTGIMVLKRRREIKKSKVASENPINC